MGTVKRSASLRALTLTSLFLLSAVAAGAAFAFLPAWAAILVVIATGYCLWLAAVNTRST